MRRNKYIKLLAGMVLTLILGACASNKTATTTTTPTTKPHVVTTPSAPKTDKTADMAFVKKVIEKGSDVQNIVSSIDFTVKSGKKDITVDGKICMRRDEVVRIQLSPMGLVEVGRLEFTRDSVLIMDRIHKQYLKSSYDQVSFLKNNGIDFYSLQALFWNQLFEPGLKKVNSEQAERFNVDGKNISLEKGKMIYTWNTDTEGRIAHTLAAYASKSNGTSTLDWDYRDFKSFANKLFPTTQSFSIQTEASGKSKKIDVIISMKKLKNDSDWDTTTKVPAKYKPVNLKDVINQILNM